MGCPEKRFQRTDSGLKSLNSPVSCRPGHYDPRQGYSKPAPGHYDPRQRVFGRDFGPGTDKPSRKKMDLDFSNVNPAYDRARAGSAAKPVISQAQLIREAFICKTAQEMMKDFTSTVLDIKDGRNGRVMWTSVPEDLKYIFNVTDIKTVDSWKQTMHGDVQLDISMFKKGDKIKMSVQSIGVSHKHMNQPLIRGVPDHNVHPETLLPSNGTTPRPPWEVREDAKTPEQRSRAGTVDRPLSPTGELEVKHRRFSVIKPKAAPRFCRSQTGTLSDCNKKTFTTNSMLPRSRTMTTESVPETTTEG